MPSTLNTRPPRQNVRVTTDLDRATADHVESVIDRMHSGLVGDVSIPKRTGTATAYWFVADNADAVTESTARSAPSRCRQKQLVRTASSPA